ncbi:unnamed protein product, partial [Nesidiocoris tenuis]
MSNAAGALNENFKIGDIMILNDHINFLGLAGVSPLRGLKDERMSGPNAVMNGGDVANADYSFSSDDSGRQKRVQLFGNPPFPQINSSWTCGQTDFRPDGERSRHVHARARSFLRRIRPSK